MTKRNESPFKCHVFICTNDRKGKRKSCADNNSAQIRNVLKEEVSNRGWKPQVRVSQCGCMGLCANGPNVILYPQKIWFSEVSENDVSEVIEAVEGILNK
jgi:(2Fe-2S) ferredoxin